MRTLLGLLDHQHPNVRKQAAGAFHDCKIQRYLAAFDLLDEPVRRSTGQLVSKVDPTTNDVLADELNCGNRVRQIRALLAIRAIGNVDPLCQAVLQLVQHPDVRLRVASIGTLAGSRLPEAKAAIRQHLMDENPSVRKAAELSLDISNHLDGIQSRA